MVKEPKKPSKKIQVKDLNTKKNPKGGESTDQDHKGAVRPLLPKL